ncbi:MAG: KpsF/GutQ family sugar-phosphate isomerase [Acidobacteria bacterium]|nr:KpsF/GutQ family sugar-phosphate isomerase [Acidobacteriota bacterium]
MSQETAKRVLKIEAEAIADLIPRLGKSFDQAVDLMAGCQGRVVVTGMGKSGIVCRKIAATLNSTGTPSSFLHPAEAIHGDLGMLAGGDVVLALSNSGETEELVRLVETSKRLGIPWISMVGNTQSTLARSSDLVLDVGVNQEACPFGLAPTASTTASLALGDALALTLSEKKGFHLEDFARLHPGGKLGKKLAKVGDLMHRGDQIPKVDVETPMDEVIYEMSSKRLGITCVVKDEDQLVGVISDGDLRRLLQKERGAVLERAAGQCMTPDPRTISEGELATSALNIMEENKITSLMVTDGSKTIVGVIHVHDLWGTEMF